MTSATISQPVYQLPAEATVMQAGSSAASPLGFGDESVFDLNAARSKTGEDIFAALDNAGGVGSYSKARSPESGRSPEVRTSVSPSYQEKSSPVTVLLPTQTSLFAAPTSLAPPALTSVGAAAMESGNDADGGYSSGRNVHGGYSSLTKSISLPVTSFGAATTSPTNARLRRFERLTPERLGALLSSDPSADDENEPTNDTSGSDEKDELANADEAEIEMTALHREICRLECARLRLDEELRMRKAALNELKRQREEEEIDRDVRMIEGTKLSAREKKVAKRADKLKKRREAKAARKQKGKKQRNMDVDYWL